MKVMGSRERNEAGAVLGSGETCKSRAAEDKAKVEEGNSGR